MATEALGQWASVPARLLLRLTTPSIGYLPDMEIVRKREVGFMHTCRRSGASVWRV
jgi:hypothetical protein